MANSNQTGLLLMKLLKSLSEPASYESIMESMELAINQPLSPHMRHAVNVTLQNGVRLGFVHRKRHLFYVQPLGHDATLTLMEEEDDEVEKEEPVLDATVAPTFSVNVASPRLRVKSMGAILPRCRSTSIAAKRSKLMSESALPTVNLSKSVSSLHCCRCGSRHVVKMPSKQRRPRPKSSRPRKTKSKKNVAKSKSTS